MKQAYPLVGTRYLGKKAIDLVKTLKAGHPVLLLREPDNAFDRRAVQVIADDVAIGYLPKAENTEISAMIDAEGFVGPNSRLAFSGRLIATPSGPMIEVDL